MIKYRFHIFDDVLPNCYINDILKKISKETNLLTWKVILCQIITKINDVYVPNFTKYLVTHLLIFFYYMTVSKKTDNLSLCVRAGIQYLRYDKEGVGRG